MRASVGVLAHDCSGNRETRQASACTHDVCLVVRGYAHARWKMPESGLEDGFEESVLAG